MANTVSIKYIDQEENVHFIDAEIGLSMLEVAHRNKVPLKGDCEGSLACSTCHIILEDDWYPKMQEPKEDEEDMLDLAFGLTKTSRLGCQIIITKEMEGFTFRLPKGTKNYSV